MILTLASIRQVLKTEPNLSVENRRLLENAHSHLEHIANAFLKQMIAAQQFHWIGGLSDGRWFSREVDIFGKCANS